LTVQLINSTGPKGPNVASATPWPTIDDYAAYGGSNDLWGEPWTVAEIKSVDFGVDVVVDTDTSAFAYVDHVRIKVNYTESLSGREWLNPENAKLQDDTPTNATFTTTSEDTSDILRLTNFGFDLPTTVTDILGIEILIDRYANESNSITDGSIRLLKDGSPVGNDNASTTPWTVGDSDTYAVYGASNDMWGTTWLYSDVNNANFGVELFVNYTGTVNDAKAQIDHVNITVYYTIDPTLTQDMFLVFPNADVTSEWEASGAGYHHQYVNDSSKIYPDTPDLNSYIFTTSNTTGNVSDVFNVGTFNVQGGNVTDITIWVYGNETAIESTVNVTCGDWSEMKQLDMSVQDWYSYAWSGLELINIHL